MSCLCFSRQQMIRVCRSKGWFDSRYLIISQESVSKGMGLRKMIYQFIYCFGFELSLGCNIYFDIMFRIYLYYWIYFVIYLYHFQIFIYLSADIGNWRIFWRNVDWILESIFIGQFISWANYCDIKDIIIFSVRSLEIILKWMSK